MNSETEKQILNYVKGKAVLIYGPTGCGKTFSVHDFAKRHNYELIELNASEKRNAEAFGKLILSSKQKSLFRKKKLFLIDELDSLRGRGAIPALVELIKQSLFPVVLISLDPWKQKFKTLRKYTVMSRIRKPSYLQVRKLLREYCIENKISYNDIALEGISRQSNGDYCSAFNDLNTAVVDGKLGSESLKYLGKREKKTEIFEVLNSVFKKKGFESFDELMGLNMELNDFVFWLSENIPIAYKSRNQVAEAYYWISRANQMLNRAKKKQEYRFYYYASLMLSAGVSLSGEASGYIPFKPSSRIMKLFRTKRKRGMVRSISGKIAEKCHVSERTATKEYLPFLKFFASGDNLLDIDEISFLKTI